MVASCLWKVYWQAACSHMYDFCKSCICRCLCIANSHLYYISKTGLMLSVSHFFFFFWLNIFCTKSHNFLKMSYTFLSTIVWNQIWCWELSPEAYQDTQEVYIYICMVNHSCKAMPLHVCKPKLFMGTEALLGCTRLTTSLVSCGNGCYWCCTCGFQECCDFSLPPIILE